MKIYLDMDGVLADFNKRFEEMFGSRPETLYHRAKHFHDNWDEFVETGQFMTLDLMPGAIELMKAVDSLGHEVEILSSTSNEEYYRIVSHHKAFWLGSQGITYKQNFVPGGSKKAAFASPWNILIDDSEHIVDHYRQAGGTAILHKDVNITIEKLHELNLEWNQHEYILPRSFSENLRGNA